MMVKKPRVVVFIVAYQAESTLEAVLSRIPASLFSDYECSILVVDDASRDRTLEVGHLYRRRHPGVPLTVLRNQFNQGYGGNQKVGYAHAIAENADAVALLHGDGQYAPEELPKLVAPVCHGETDAVLGSRMLEPFGALRGGMPLYKFVGNRVLTGVQNRLLGTRLSEFHSGYRVYSVPLLRRLHFKLNSNEFHFDSEIIIQILNAGGRILELPIPTYYGDEICRVDGIKYARDVLRVTLQNVAHRAGLLHQRRFHPVGTPTRTTTSSAIGESNSFLLREPEQVVLAGLRGRENRLADVGGYVQKIVKRLASSSDSVFGGRAPEVKLASRDPWADSRGSRAVLRRRHSRPRLVGQDVAPSQLSSGSNTRCCDLRRGSAYGGDLCAAVSSDACRSDQDAIAEAWVGGASAKRVRPSALGGRFQPRTIRLTRSMLTLTIRVE